MKNRIFFIVFILFFSGECFSQDILKYASLIGQTVPEGFEYTGSTNDVDGYTGRIDNFPVAVIVVNHRIRSSDVKYFSRTQTPEKFIDDIGKTLVEQDWQRLAGQVYRKRDGGTTCAFWVEEIGEQKVFVIRFNDDMTFDSFYLSEDRKEILHKINVAKNDMAKRSLIGNIDTLLLKDDIFIYNIISKHPSLLRDIYEKINMDKSFFNSTLIREAVRRNIDVYRGALNSIRNQEYWAQNNPDFYREFLENIRSVYGNIDFFYTEYNQLVVNSIATNEYSNVWDNAQVRLAELDIYMMERFHNIEIIQHIIKQRTNLQNKSIEAKKPLVVMIYPQWDHNKAFVMDNRIRNIIDAGNNVLYFEVGGNYSFNNTLNLLVRNLPDSKEIVLIIGGHGEQEFVQMSELPPIDSRPLVYRPSDYWLDIHDFEDSQFTDSLHALNIKMLVLESCSTGQGEEIAQNIANCFADNINGTVYAPLRPVPVPRYFFNSDGSIKEVLYNSASAMYTVKGKYRK